MRSEMNLMVELSMSRGSDNTIRLRVRDEESRIQFLEIPINLKDFGYLVTGGVLSDYPALGDKLEHVGKRKISEKRQVFIPKGTDIPYDGRSKWIEDNCQEPGWYVASYLGAKGAVEYLDSGYIFHYSVFRYVDIDGSKLTEE